MALIDRTYFVGELTIPGLQSPAVSAELTALIAKYEVEYLRTVLGYSLAKLFLSAIAGGSPAARFVAIRDGAEYTDTYDRLQVWEGLANSSKESPIANLTYFWWVRNAASNTAGAGEVKSNTENARGASPYLKQMKAWNAMCDMTDSLVAYINANIADYPEYTDSANVYEKIGLL